MRLHRLEVTAFGPFAERVVVDFDTLGEAGLFLLSGATGAGKTSVLDAVCFALYGEVPGDRNGAKRLRCDRAAPETAPRVVLEVGLGCRRLRFDRSPAWSRPKRRGSGTTQQQAAVTLSDRVDGTWRVLSSRIDETAHLVAGLLGMSHAQFCQVVVLPQGRFQAFLRARSEDRQRLLQQLFRTGRFEDLERWLRERRAKLRAEEGALRDALAHVVARVSETAGVTAPAAPLEGADEGPATWARQLTAAARTQATATQAARDRAAECVAERSVLVAAAARTAELLARHRAAVEELADLERGAAEQRAARDRLHRAGRANALRPLLASHDRATTSARGTESMADRRRRRCAATGGVPPGDVTEAWVAAQLAAIGDERARLRALRPRAAELARLRDERSALGARLEDARERLDVAGAAETTAAGAAATARTRAEETREASSRRDEARARLSARRTQAQAFVQLEQLAPQVAEAERLLAECRDQVLDGKERWLTLRELRINGMAAELAGGLAVGGACPVCGSCEHPTPARSDAASPDAERERHARRLLDDAEAALVAHHARVLDLRTRLAEASGAAATAGPMDSSAVRSDLVRLETLVDRLSVLADASDEAAAASAAAGAALERARADHTQAAAGVAALTASVAALDDRTSGLDDEVRLALGGAPGHTLEEAESALASRVADLEAARQALAALAHARSALEQATTTLAAAATEHGFADKEDVASALLDEPLTADLEASVAAYERRWAHAHAVLEEPELAEATAAEPPDLPAASAALEEARIELSAAEARLGVAAARADRLVLLARALDEARQRWAPVHGELAVVAHLSAFVEGRSADNRLQMRLSAYVLAARLAQVVAAANLRLAAMSDQRYALVHTGQRGAGETRGGLSLLVRDDWSGETRDPATLSGGEMFVVALALALGLADVVAEEAGGVDLDTLFIDEGFGSLDADTLDDVMDTLDSLRDGGRVVGVVSHVAQMRERIPTRLEVEKHRAGSTLRLVRST